MQRPYCRYPAFDTMHTLSPPRINEPRSCSWNFQARLLLNTWAVFRRYILRARSSFSNYPMARYNVLTRGYRVNSFCRSQIFIRLPRSSITFYATLSVGQPNGNTNTYCRETSAAIREPETSFLLRNDRTSQRKIKTTCANILVHASVFANDRLYNVLTESRESKVVAKEIPNVLYG